MVAREKVILSWSGGKDSAIALYKLIKDRSYEIAVLLTTITEEYDRTCMHGIRRVLVEEQADSLGIPLEKVFISKDTSSKMYESIMKGVLERYLDSEIKTVAFGDIFLEDLRKHREGNLAKIGMNAIFPIWKRNTKDLANEFINLGFKAVITCIDGNLLDKKFVGRTFDNQFINELPQDIDPCGENGEFHSFVYEGPIFKQKLLHTKGEIVLRDNRFFYCDIIPIHQYENIN